jgi:hypothetical protein
VKTVQIEEMLKAELKKHPDQQAEDLAKAIDLEVRQVKKALYGHLDLFEVGYTTKAWRIREEDMHRASDERPNGPFGPADSLIPEGQVLKTIDHRMQCGKAMKILLETGYTALPVTSEGGEIVGVVTLNSINEFLIADSEFRDRSNPKKRATVHDCLLGDVMCAVEFVRFVPPKAYLDDCIDWEQIDHVIVGSPDKPLGMLTITDIWRKLDDFTELFVLIEEIEIGLRRVIQRIIREQGFTEDDLVYHDGESPKGTMTTLDLQLVTFHSYRYLFDSPRFAPHADPLLGPIDTLNVQLKEVNGIRNKVMHFDHDRIEPGDRKVLKRFCIRIRNALVS